MKLVACKTVFETCANGQLLCRIYSTRSQRRLSGEVEVRGGDRCRGRWRTAVDSDSDSDSYLSNHPDG